MPENVTYASFPKSYCIHVPRRSIYPYFVVFSRKRMGKGRWGFVGKYETRRAALARAIRVALDMEAKSRHEVSVVGMTWFRTKLWGHVEIMEIGKAEVKEHFAVVQREMDAIDDILGKNKRKRKKVPDYERWDHI